MQPSRRDTSQRQRDAQRQSLRARPSGIAAVARALAFVAAMIAFAPAIHATTYKWVDDQGIVHYTDKMPPEAVNKGSVELNKQGVPIKKNDPALTAEQRRAHEAEEEQARQIAKARDDVRRKDRALLQSYTTESEIDLAKQRALSTIDAQVQSAQAYTVNLNKRKQEIGGRIAALGDKPRPPALDRELANVNDELEKQADLIATKRREITVVTARYDADKQRWHELQKIAEANPSGAAAAGLSIPSGTTTAPPATAAAPAASAAPAAPAKK